MQVKAIKTRRIQEGDSLEEILDTYIPSLEEKSIVAVTSKIVSVSQRRVVPKTECTKLELIKKEADAYIGPLPHERRQDLYLTVKNDILIFYAGIDESNGGGVYILHPTEVQKVAYSLWAHLRAKHKIKHLGVIITDSNSPPMRTGVIGFPLGWCGFEPLYSYNKRPDIYGQPMVNEILNLVDALAVSADLMMGGGDEQQPIAIIKNPPKVNFLERPPTKEEEESITIPLEKSFYAPFLLSAPWVRNR